MSARRDGQRPLVPADAWRRPLSRHRDRRTRRRHRLPAADRPGGRRARLFRRAAADRQELRGLLGRRLGAGAADGAASVPGGGAAGPPVAGRRRAHDGDARPHLARPAPDQRRHRRRSGREQGRRHLPVARRALRGDARVPRGLSRAPCRRDGQLFRQAHPHRGRPAALRAGAEAAIRRSISAARRTPGSMSRPSRSTST